MRNYALASLETNDSLGGVISGHRGACSFQACKTNQRERERENPKGKVGGGGYSFIAQVGSTSRPVTSHACLSSLWRPSIFSNLMHIADKIYRDLQATGGRDTPVQACCGSMC